MLAAMLRALLCFVAPVLAPAFGPASAGRAPLHPGPPFNLQLEVDEEGVLFLFNGEQRYLNGLLGLDPQQRYAGTLTSEVQTVLDEHALALLREHAKLALEGRSVEPRIEKTLVFESGLANYEPTVEVHARYPWPGVPSELKLEWDLFAPDGSQVPGVVRFGDFDFQFFSLEPAEPGVSWYPTEVELEPGTLQRPPVAPGERSGALYWPELSLLLLTALLSVGFGRFASRSGPGGLLSGKPGWIAAGGLVAAGGLAAWDLSRPAAVRMPSREQCAAIFAPLHRTIYAALGARSEDEMYAILASAVATDFIEPLYLELRESMIRRSDGGAWCQVTSIDDLDYQVDTPPRLAAGEVPAFDITWRWRVEGRVTHYGHTHTRRNLQRARYHVIHDGEGWKIAGRVILEHERSDDGEDFYPVDPPEFDPPSEEDSDG